MQKYILVLLSFLSSVALLRAQYTTCSVVVEDEQSDNYRVDVKKELFFTHTSEQLRPFFKDRDYLRCEGYLTYISGGYYFFNLNFTVATPNANEEFGGIQQGAALYIELMNGNSIRLVARDASFGQYDEEQQVYKYSAQYPLSAAHVKRLGMGEVDKVRVIWTQGYENYEVYYLDFFINQFNCLAEGIAKNERKDGKK